jgi:cytosine/adenosine deaminase-related metal-dependent hydrolase
LADESATCRAGVSPHAPYSVTESLYRRADSTGLPLAIHLAETRAELDLLGDRSGPFVSFLDELNAWAPTRLMTDPERVIELSTGIQPYLFVHCNYLPPATPIPFHGTVVYCPRTHDAFGHPPHPFREFLGRTVRVALGTDSLASNPDLSVLAEARFLQARHPDLPGVTLLRLSTLAGAAALGWHAETGSLVRGKSADLAIVELPQRDEADPHGLLFDSARPVCATWFRGRPVYPTAR